ncbi:MAG: CocE/NonD family hydrolase, partial [Candidatus Limnocylindrales bacterium]
WLRDERNGADQEPMLRVYVQDPVPVDPFPDHIAGRWWVADHWPLAAPPSVMELGPGQPLDGPGEGADVSGRAARWHGALTVGQGAPFWCGSGPPQGVPGDQRDDDARSLCYTSQPLEEDLVIVGRPRVRLRVGADQPVAQVAVRLCDVAPDGTSALIARGALNLTHRHGHDQPTELIPGEDVPVAVRLSTAAARIRAGHRLRVAIAGAAWPLAWPAPQRSTLTVHHDPERPAVLELALATGMVPDPRPPGAPRAEPDPTGLPEAIDLPAGPPAWSVDQAPDGTVTIANEAFEATRFPERGGLEWHGEARYRVAIHPDRPDSCVADGVVGYRIAYPGGPTAGARGSIQLTADAKTIHLAIELDVDEDGRRVHEGRWSEAIPRDLL